MMTTKQLAAAMALALPLAIGGHALAQTAAEPNAAPMPLNDGTISNATGTPIGSGMATGTPGVGLDTNEATEGAGATKGPGGLQNGVGAEGTLAPSTTGSNNDVIDTPAASGPDEGGIPLDPAPAAPAN